MTANKLNNFSYLNNLCGLFLAALMAFPAIAFSQENINIEIKTKGLAGSTVVSDAATKRVTFHAVSKGSISQYLNFNANGPAGLRGYVEARQIKRGGKLGPVFRLQFPKKKKGYTTELIDGSTSALITMGGSDPTADQISRIKKATGLSESVIKILLGFMTEEQIIAQYGKPTVEPTPSGSGGNGDGGGSTTPSVPGQLTGRSLLSKDSCDKSVTDYDLSFVVDLSKVDRAIVGNSFTVSASISASEGFPAAASIKPTSDGKFAPRPLVLIQSVGYGYGSTTTLNLLKWKKGRPGSPRALKIEDYIYYRGQALARAVADGILTGGKGTFEISNGSSVGTACFNLIRTRQKANGYQGGD